MRRIPLCTGLLAVLLSACAGERPATLGLQSGHLASCPQRPNCVASTAEGEQQISPIGYAGSREAARERLLRAVHSEPRATIVTLQDDYLHVEFASALFGFVDDAEFHLPAGRPVIEMRSAARLGRSDFGVNRRRLERLRAAFEQAP